MGSKFTILFTYMDFLFIGEIIKQLVDRVPVYDVFYALAANPESIGELEIYRGSAPDHGICWRQRFSERETELADPDLVEIIGRAIKIQEDIQSR
jgi:hypothetical protein